MRNAELMFEEPVDSHNIQVGADVCLSGYIKVTLIVYMCAYTDCYHLAGLCCLMAVGGSLTFGEKCDIVKGVKNL